MNNDLISREALKEVINDLFRSGEYDCASVLKAIDNAPTVETDIEVVAKDAYEQGYTDGWKERFGEPDERPQGEWIPVNERLPEVYKKVLVSDVFGVYIGEFIDAEENWGGKHFINEHGMQSKSVVAWQPLPEPYKEGEQKC